MIVLYVVDLSTRFLKKHIVIFAFLSIFITDMYSQDKNYIALSSAVFDILQQDAPSFEGRVEFRLGKLEYFGHPFTGFMFNTGGAIHLFAGLYYDIHLGDYFILTPGFAPGLYVKRNSKDLMYVLEFRSQIEFTYIFKNHSRIGFSFNHISNASLGEENPGVESIALTYVIPF